MPKNVKTVFSTKNEEILDTLGFNMTEVPGEGHNLFKKRRFETQLKVLFYLYELGEENLGEEYPLLLQLKEDNELKKDLLMCLKPSNLLSTYIEWEKITSEVNIQKGLVTLHLERDNEINLTLEKGIKMHKKSSLRREEENDAREELSLKGLKKLLDL